jgi:hypothetical protein
MVQAASVSIHGPHGQYIENVHLEPFESEEQFWNVHYREAYSKLLNKAEEFVKSTGGASDDTLVFIRQVRFVLFIAPNSDVKVALAPDLTPRNMRHRLCLGITGRSQPHFSIVSHRMFVHLPISGLRVES